jgi:CRISPR-associated protein Cmr5
MNNLEQVRAKHALKMAPNLSKDDVNKLPALVANNGLLATAAFCRDKKGGLLDAINAVADYLHERSLCNGGDNGLLRTFTESGGSSAQLRLATVEALAYLAYLKRFAAKKEG